MAHHRDLRELVSRLDERGKLYRFQKRINKDTELVPFYRVQLRGLPDHERKVFLFDNVVGAKGAGYEMSVLAGIYGASEEILAFEMGCQSYTEMLEKWHEALVRPVAPVVVDDGPVQEEVHVGKEVQELGLDEFPAPVEEPGFSGIIRTGLPMITRDPETGIRNVGTYNGFFRARDRLVSSIAPIHHARVYHWKTAERRREGLPVAIVIGCSPEVMWVGSADIPYGTDELAVAGGIAGSPVELVRCRTIPLEVPAHAEAVIEGLISTEIMEPGLPFGEYPGYMNGNYHPRPVIHVTAVTHRKKAMFTPVLVGFPPSDTNVVWGFCNSAQVYHHLKYECGFPVDEVYFPEMGGASTFCLIRIGEGCPQETVQQILEEAGKDNSIKYIVAVDSDIKLQDPELLLWALTFRTQPQRDFTFSTGGHPGLDPSGAPTPGWKREREDRGGASQLSRVFINATRKWPYPPVALPQKEYMERALEIWRGETDLPTPRLREPWHGYMLGHWDEQLEEFASLIVRGEYLKVGEKMAKLQEKVRQADREGR